MPGFFEQLCEIVAETAKSTPPLQRDCEAAKAFFAEIPVQKQMTAAPAAPRILPSSPPASPSSSPSSVPPAAAAVKSASVPAVPENLADTDLAGLAKIVAACSACPLCRTRNTTVFGEGNPDAQLMFIGEAPGFDEDRQGRPFVGKAGALLNKMIKAMQFTREEVYIANIAKCRPPDNRNPTPEEAAMCIRYLHRQIELIRPEVIVLLGATAVKYLLNTTSGISKLRGRWLSFHNIPVMPTFHPAFLLRQEAAKKDAWQDLQQVMARFGKYHKK